MLDKNDQIYLCSLGNVKVFVIAKGREEAKKQAHGWIGGDREQYVVSPLTNPGDRIHFHMTLFI